MLRIDSPPRRVRIEPERLGSVFTSTEPLLPSERLNLFHTKRIIGLVDGELLGDVFPELRPIPEPRPERVRSILRFALEVVGCFALIAAALWSPWILRALGRVFG